MPRPVKRGLANVQVSPAIVDKMLAVLADEGRTLANYANRAVEQRIVEDYQMLQHKRAGEINKAVEVTAES